MNDRMAKLIATFFYIGELPGAPGTFASAAGVGVYFLLFRSPVLYMIVLALLTVLGFQASGRLEALLKKKDPGCIVIDEVVGILIGLFLLPPTPAVLWTGFFLFRAFDMFKTYPACKYEHLPGGKGVMLDDIIAGVYTNLTLQIAVRLAGII